MIDLQGQQFSSLLLDWYDLHGRKNLPWQLNRDPYRIWISEIMLQQTQVQTVIPYFNQFIQCFPSIIDLANAKEDHVLSLWSGLGYYSRARNLHHTAKIICHQFSGKMPQTLVQLKELPGIGPSTAAAILAQAYNLPAAILDGNVKRVLTRFFRIAGWPEQAAVKKTLWNLADECMPNQRCADYTQAIMDLGATCCTLRNPKCPTCPIKEHCQAQQHNEQLLYPTKKNKQPLPIQHQQFLVLYNDNQMVYLEKRPPEGLWGGLWCLPSIANELCPLSYIKQHYSFLGTEAKHLLSIKHRFSHFQLNIDAVQIKIDLLVTPEVETKGLWLKQDQLSQLGLAKPTSDILRQLQKVVSP